MKQIDLREVPDDFRELVAPLLEPFKRKRSGGKPPLSQRTILAGIIYKCRTGWQWDMLPVTAQKAPSMNIFSVGIGAASLPKISSFSLKNTGSGWNRMAGNGWLSGAGSSARSKKSANEGLGRNPTDRGRNGSKIHLHVDGQGIPLGMTVVGANVHDSRLIGLTLQNSCEMGAWFLGGKERHLCLDKGYDYDRVYIEVYINGFEGYIWSRKEEKELCPDKKARRWVVERTIAWLKGFRSIRHVIVGT